MTGMGCYYCGTGAADELRPYGPGGAPVCCPCVTSDPKRNADAQAAFHTLIEAEAAATGVDVVVVGLASGSASVAEEMCRAAATPPGSPGR